MPDGESNHIEIEGVRLQLSRPVKVDQQWIGQVETLRSLLACWIVLDERDLPLSPRLIGPPGIGKTTLAMAGARERGQPLHIYQCTSDTRPEDLLVTPVLAESGRIAYHASPLVSAMLTGGVCVLDEGNRMNEKSWASLAPLLDHRRYVESVIAGIAIPAAKEFRCCVTMNDDESTYEVPDYIMSRLQPTLAVGFPSRQDEMAILRYHIPFAEEDILALTVDFLQRAHELDLEFSPRDGINIIRFALKRLSQQRDHPLASDAAWREAIEKVLGEEAIDLDRVAAERRSAMSAGGSFAPLSLTDLLFDSEDDPMRPGGDDAGEGDGTPGDGSESD